MLRDAALRQRILDYLTHADGLGPLPAADVAGLMHETSDEAFYVSILAAESFIVRDDQGNTSEPPPDAFGFGEVPGVDILGGQDGFAQIILEPGAFYEVEIHPADTPLTVDVVRGTGALASRLERFLDQELPVGSCLLLYFDEDGFAGAFLDHGCNGAPDEPLAPTATADSPDGVDIDPPDLVTDMTVVTPGVARVSASATDEGSGLKELLVSTDGSLFELYVAPVEVTMLDTPSVFFIAEDYLGNRAVAEVRTGRNGDGNGDGNVDVLDVFYLINHLFAGGPAPLAPADANGDGNVDVLDVFYLINHLFAGGPTPV